MAASNFMLGKASGGILSVSPADGTTNTSLVLPASGTVVATDVNGNLGLGVSNPANYSSKLAVAGTIASVSLDGNTQSNVTADNTGKITIGGYNASNTNYLVFTAGGGAERLRIDTAGNVGIGVTPSAWSGFKALQQQNTSISSNLNEQYITSNGYYNGSNWIYNSNTGASQYLNNQGIHKWYTAPSGTAGNAITWYTAMTLDANGALIHSAGVKMVPPSANTYLNATATVIDVGNMVNNRSINARGTINASGADYAEYEYSNSITLIKGQIVGFKADGTLTDKYSEAIRFAIKSTNPSIVGGDAWGTEEIIGKRPERPVKSEEMTDEEFAKLEEQYEKDLADFENRLEAERQKVDRIAYAGKVPVNVYGAVPGQYVIAVEKDGGIDGKLVNKADMTFAEYQDAVGRVNKILDDGRVEVAVIIH